MVFCALPIHKQDLPIITNVRYKEQVAQLSLTNPCDALHHGKRQNFKNSHVTITTTFFWVICHPVARIDIAYLCTKFDDFRFSRSSDVIGAPSEGRPATSTLAALLFSSHPKRKGIERLIQIIMLAPTTGDLPMWPSG